METLYHSEYCDGKEHWVCCNKPITWNACNDWRPCNKKCLVYINQNKENLCNCNKSTTTVGLVETMDKCTLTDDLDKQKQ